MFKHWLWGAGIETFGLINGAVVFWMFHHLVRIYLGGPYFPHINSDDWITELGINLCVIEICFNTIGHRRNVVEFCFWVVKFAAALTLVFLSLDLGAVYLRYGTLETLLLGTLAMLLLRAHYRAQPPYPTYKAHSSGVPFLPKGIDLRRRKRWL